MLTFVKKGMSFRADLDPLEFDIPPTGFDRRFQDAPRQQQQRSFFDGRRFQYAPPRQQQRYLGGIDDARRFSPTGIDIRAPTVQPALFDEPGGGLFTGVREPTLTLDIDAMSTTGQVPWWTRLENMLCRISVTEAARRTISVNVINLAILVTLIVVLTIFIIPSTIFICSCYYQLIFIKFIRKFYGKL